MKCCKVMMIEIFVNKKKRIKKNKKILKIYVEEKKFKI